MNKKLITSVLVALLITPAVAKAEPSQAPTVAVIDTALDTSMPFFKDRVVFEACVLEYNSCPNKQSIMEGPGSATMPIEFMRKNGLDHGTQMAYTVLSQNKDIKIVFIRIAGITPNGTPQRPSEVTFIKALDWVISNQSKFNIQAVSMSQGSSSNLGRGLDYCPKTVSTQSRIKNLISLGVPTFVPTGNGRDLNRIEWPACLNESIAVGAVDQYQEIPLWSKIDINKTDFYALGVLDVLGPNSTSVRALGTSVSVQVAAATWMKLKSAKPTYTFDQLYSTFTKTAVVVKNPQGLSGRMMYIEGALNG